jgi:hypothetical protein
MKRYWFFLKEMFNYYLPADCIVVNIVYKTSINKTILMKTAMIHIHVHIQIDKKQW